MLYAYPIWAEVTKIKKFRLLLTRVQRKIGLRIGWAYWTVSEDAINTITGMPQFEESIKLRMYIYKKVKEGTSKLLTQTQGEEEPYKRWQEKWDKSSKGIWTYRLIPNIKFWIIRGHSFLTYQLTRFLSDHGCFSHYLWKKNGQFR